MRLAAMQILTWGTIAAAICSALLLAALDSSEPPEGAAWPALKLPSEPTQAGRRMPQRAVAPVEAASTASAAAR